MTQPKLTDSPESVAPDTSFGDILSEFEQAHHSRGETVEGTVVSVTPDAVFVDIGRKMDGVIVPDPAHPIKRGDKVLVSIRGRDERGQLPAFDHQSRNPARLEWPRSRVRDKRTIGGTVLEVVKGGLRVDVGVRAFMPASRSGVREQAEMEKLVGQQIECRITKLDTETEDVVVDRRVVLEERERADETRSVRAAGRRRRGARNRAQPYRFRRLRRSGRHRRAAARLRHVLRARR